MAKYKLTVKYENVCELSIAGDIPDIIGNEFDQYLKSMLFKKEEWENFEANFKVAAKQEYGNLCRKQEEENALKEDLNTQEENTPEENLPEENTPETEADSAPEAENNTAPEADTNKKNEIRIEITLPEEEDEEEEGGGAQTLSFEDYVKNKNISTPLDEFVAGACYLDEILDIKEFSLKELNAKLFPVFGRLAASNVIEEAKNRVLIETVKENLHTKYKINQNAWNYHNYDLVRH